MPAVATLPAAQHAPALLALGQVGRSGPLLAEVGRAEVGRAEVGRAEVVAAEVVAAEVDAAGVGRAEMAPAEVAHSGAKSGEAAAREVAPPEVLSPEVFAPLAPASVTVSGFSGPGRFNGAGRSTAGRQPVDAGTAAEQGRPGSLAIKVTRAKDTSPLKAEVTLLSSETEVIERHWTGADGEFIVSALAGGNYELVVQSLGFRPETVPVEIADGYTRGIELALVGLAHIYGAVAGPEGAGYPASC